jgi:DNA polymerase
MFGVPVEKHGVNGHLRQKGKVAELALGYGGGVGALRAMGALEMGVPEEELQSIVTAWRNASPNIVRLWWNVDAAVKTAIRARRSVKLFHLTFACRAGMLFITLPSGRCLSYVRPRLTQNRFGGESIEYLGIGPSKKWERIESYGPKFVENIVQGISRDLLCEAMLKLRDRRIVAHVHDEVILETDLETTVQEVCDAMAQCPSWAEGLLLRADGYECEYYRKDWIL